MRLAAALIALAACGDSRAPTGAVCPPGSTLTYDEFAAPSPSPTAVESPGG